MIGIRQRKILRFSYTYPGWFSITRYEPETVRSADRLAFRGLLEKNEHGQYRAPRNAIRVLNRIHNAYGGDPYGVDTHTISEGWRNALNRVGAVV